MPSELSVPSDEPAIKVEGLSKEYQRKLRTKGPTGNAALNLLLAQMRLPRWLGGKKKKADNRIVALDDVSFEVRPGTCLGVIGPNGAGKSTLLKVMARSTPPTAGRVTMRGRVASLLELGLGLRDDLTGRENVLLAGAMYGVSRRFIEERLEEIEAFSGLGQMFDEQVKAYSSGMYVRLSFALMINLKPQILLADEILAVGDMQFQEQCIERVRNDVADGLTVLFVSHDMAAIEVLCDRVLWLDKGRVMMIGETLEVIDAYRDSVHGVARALPVIKSKPRDSVFHNEELVIAWVKLLSAEGKETGHLDRSRSSFIEIGLEAKKPGIRTRVAVDFEWGNVKVFRTVTPIVTFEQPGTKRATVHLPPNLLADIEYKVHVKARFVGRHTTDTVTASDALTFRVYDDTATDPDSADADAYLLEIKRHGSHVLRPQLDWQVESDTLPAIADREAKG
ncbi:ABC transporter ATP-binding protein [Tistlia consotensis]|nr:ABC transporter ATP-binding protein [Tistlia consotensis]